MADDDDGPDLSCFDFGEEEEEAPHASSAKSAGRGKKKKGAKDGASASLSGGASGCASGAPTSLGDLQKAHRQEEQQLRTEAKARKHAIPKADRAARADADAELDRALADMRERHARELSVLGGDEAAKAAEALSTLSVGGSASGGSKQAKRRERKEAEARAKEMADEEERANAGPTARETELAALQACCCCGVLSWWRVVVARPSLPRFRRVVVVACCCGGVLLWRDRACRASGAARSCGTEDRRRGGGRALSVPLDSIGTREGGRCRRRFHLVPT